ncbi:MAG: protein translocase subunit SecD [Ruminococcaceae bacterium]|nr:protein translocase subunit SecD [Oscillospiraceae bacterium]
MKSKRKGILPFFLVAALILALTFTAFFGVKNYYGDTELVYFKGADDIRWGIDIRGGVEAVFSPDKEGIKITDDDIDAAKAILETRLVNQNITDYEVYADKNNNQIIVRFPWAADESDFDAASAVQELGATALLKFCKDEDAEKVILTGADVQKATPAYQEVAEGQFQYVVQLELKSSGKTKFAAATKEQLNKTISIWMDDSMISAPTVNSQITDGKAIITGMANAEEAEALADKINAGSLPFALTVDDSKLQVISPTLGNDALRVMVIAGSIAFALVCALMIIRYRLNGFVASLALLGQLAGSIACISGYFPSFESFTLTIPGIAGIILSIGVGVDCNVIAAERIRDEFEKGKTIDGAIDSGYKNSLSAIIDGNVTIVIVSIVLMGAFGTPDSLLAQIFSPLMSLFGTSITGSIYSFGYTLLVGTIFNLIMGVLASRIMIKSISKIKFLRKPALYGGKKNA